jgi:hypothetical protein
MKLTKTTIWSLTLSIVLLLILSVVFVCEYHYIQSSGERILENKKQLEQDKNELKYFSKLERSMPDIKNDSERANDYFIKRENLDSFIDLIEEIKESTNATISVSLHEQEKDKQKYLDVIVKIDGEYSQVYHALQVLQELPYQTEIVSVNFQKNNNVKDAKWSASVNLIGNII